MKLFYLIALSFVYPTLSAQTIVVEQRRGEKGKLSGIIKNEKGEPLPYASIYIHDVKWGSAADSSGHYQTANLNPGKYLVEVTNQGYASAIERVTINGNAEHNFTLNSRIMEQAAVTVTGVSSATRVKLSPQSVDIVKRTDLLQNASNNLIDALARKSGISAITTGPAISKPVIRGLGYNRVLTVNDGVRQEGQQWGDEHGIEIDEYSVQRVEILKGPASLMYGSDALAGVINVITNQPVPQGTFRANLLGTYNANNNLQGIYANVAAHNNRGLNWNIYTTNKSSADYKNKFDGRVLNSRFSEKNAGGYIGVNKSWGYSHLLISNVSQQLGLIEGERDSATGKFLLFAGQSIAGIANNAQLKSKDLLVPYQKIKHTKFALDNSIAIGNGRLSATIGYQVNHRQEFADALAPDNADLFFDLRTFNYNLGYHFPANKQWKTTIGANGMQQSNRNRASETIIPAYQLFDVGGFIFSAANFGKWNVSGGLRIDSRTLSTDRLVENNTVKFQSFTRKYGNVSGSVGVSYAASEQVTLKANIARGYRAPGIAELSSNGAHEGTNRYEYGDADLKTETSYQLDAGFELNTNHFTFGVNAYLNRINNYIFYRKLSNITGADSTVILNGEELGAFRFDQSSGVRFIGFEANFDVHPHPLDWLHFENTFSLVGARFQQAIEGTKRLPFIPAPRLLSELRANFANKKSVLQDVYFKIEMDATARRQQVFYAYNTETPTAGYLLFNAGVGTDVMLKGRKAFSLMIAVNNVTDEAYQNHLSRLKYAAINNVTGRQGVFNMGRNVSLKINIPFECKLVKK